MRQIFRLGILIAPMVWAAVAPGVSQGKADRQAASSATENKTTQLGTPGRTWLGVDSKPLPFNTDEEVLEFLRTARVVSQKKVKIGVNRISKVLLEKDGIQVHAAFRDVEIQQPVAELADGSTIINFRDDCRFEIAAYRLSQILGLNNVPPVVKRRIGKEKGTLQIWVEGTMMEQDRVEKKLKPQGGLRWVHQFQIMRSFDNLIGNTDRNQGNILIDPDWNVWLIDHTRSFGLEKALRTPYPLLYCNADFWEKVEALDSESLKKEMKGVLSKGQIKSMLQRRDALMEKVDKLLQKRAAQR